MNYWDQYQKVAPMESTTTQQQPISQEVAQNPETSSYWSQYQKVNAATEQPEEVPIGVRLLGRASETILGFPGDVESFGRAIIPGVSDKRFLPTSHELRELGKEFHGEKLEPKGDVEKNVGTFIQDYLLSPGGPVKKAVLSSAGAIAEKGLKIFGVDQDAASLGKAAVMFTGSFLGKKNVKNYIKQEYDAASKAIPRNATIPGNQIVQQLSSLQSKYKKGLEPAQEKEAIGYINKILGKVSQGKGNIEVEEADKIFHQLNRLYGESTDPIVRGYISEINGVVRKSLKDYGKNVNPAYLQAFNNANAAYAGVAQGKKAVNTISKWKKTALLTGAPALAAELYFVGPQETATTLGAIATGYGLAHGYDLASRIFSNPTLFKYYTKAGAAAASENLPQFIKNSRKLDIELRKTNPNSSHVSDYLRQRRMK